MRISSAKAKGRRAVMLLKQRLLSHFTELQPDDLRITSSSVTGEDLLLSPLASKAIPFVFEVKNTESLNVWKAINQAKMHVKDSRTPLVVFMKNNEKLHVACDLELFLSLIARKI